MDVTVWCVPKSDKARAIAKILGLTERQVAGQYINHLPVAITCSMAAALADVLKPEWAASIRADVLSREARIRANQGDAYADVLVSGGWALGMSYKYF